MAIKGNFTMGGRSFAAKQASSGGNKKKKQTGTSFGPAGMVGSDQRLQNLIDRKDELKTQPGGQGDDRNLYQVKMNEFINQNPQNQKAYASRFPIQNFMTQGLPSIASKIMPGAGALSLLANIGNKIKGGLSRAGDFFGGQNDPVQLSGGFRQGPPAYDASGLAGYQDAIMRNLPPVVSTNPDDMNIARAQPDFRFDGPFVPNPQDMMIPEARRPVEDVLPTDPNIAYGTEGLKSLFTGATPQDPRPVREQFSSTFQQPFNPPMIPGGNPRGEVQSARLGSLLGSDPNIPYGQEMNMLDVLAERARRGFNEGGLASINNPQYNMLMKASNFDV